MNEESDELDKKYAGEKAVKFSGILKTVRHNLNVSSVDASSVSGLTKSAVCQG
jgi:hypothetical protein